MVNLLTNREKEIINKKISGARITQNESNILSKSIRPKLKEISKINALEILKKIEYNQKAKSIEERIRNIIHKIIPNVDSITICGSAIQNNYKHYNDIDIIVASKRKLKNKKEIIKKIKEEGKIQNINLDVQIYSKKAIIEQYPRNPSLIYQLKDSKTIYGKLKLPRKILLTPIDLKMKLDWSEADNYSESKEIYYALRNAVLVSLLINKKVDNKELKNNLIDSLGKDLAEKLRKNIASKKERKLSLDYLKFLVSSIENKLNNAKWEKIELENH